MIRTLAAAAVLFALPALPAGAATAPPDAGIASFAALPTPLPRPYDPQADGNAPAVAAKISAAQAQARAAGKLLLVEMGGNWCPDCRILAGTMQLPPIRRFVDAHYVTVLVDCGRHMEANGQVPARYGVEKLAGVPSVFIVDPATDRLLDAGHTPALDDARHMTPQALADWLAQWPPAKAAS